MPKQNHTTSIHTHYTSDTRTLYNEITSRLAEFYGIKQVILIEIIKELNQYVPKENRYSSAKIAKRLYGKHGSRQQIDQLVQKYTLEVA